MKRPLKLWPGVLPGLCENIFMSNLKYFIFLFFIFYTSYLFAENNIILNGHQNKYGNL